MCGGTDIFVCLSRRRAFLPFLIPKETDKNVCPTTGKNACATEVKEASRTMHCGRFISPSLTRRDMLARCAGGFGAVALAALSADPVFGASPATAPTTSPTDVSPLAPRKPHFKAKAKNVIFLYMDGGPSQVDTFDPKPLLTEEHGQPFKMKMEPTQFNNNGNTLGSPWKFKPGGKSGLPVSDLFPFVRECVDDLAVVRSMTSNFSEHTDANYFLHTGTAMQGRPSMGAWVGYGLGASARTCRASSCSTAG